MKTLIGIMAAALLFGCGGKDGANGKDAPPQLLTPMFGYWQYTHNMPGGNYRSGNLLVFPEGYTARDGTELALAEYWDYWTTDGNFDTDIVTIQELDSTDIQIVFRQCFTNGTPTNCPTPLSCSVYGDDVGPQGFTCFKGSDSWGFNR